MNGQSSHLEEEHDNAIAQSPPVTTEVNGHVTNGFHDAADGTAVADAPQHGQDTDPAAHPPTSPARGRKRKLSETRSGKSKKPSPPWKSFSADGPTSFKSEDGRRKSGRMNTLPLELQPQGKRRQTRGEHSVKSHNDKVTTPRGRNVDEHARASKVTSGSKRANLALSSVSRATASHRSHSQSGLSKGVQKTKQESKSSSQTRPLRDPDASRRSSRRQYSSMDGAQDLVDQPQETQGLGGRLRTRAGSKPDHPRIMLRFGPPSIPVLNPANIPPARRHENLDEWLRRDHPLDGEEEKLPTEREMVKEAESRIQLMEASRPGGVLDNVDASFEDDPPEAPFFGYAHNDYLVLHVQDLQMRMQRESKEHRALAKRLAQAAAAQARSKMPKSAEELEADARASNKERLKSVLKQLRSHLDLASQRIMEIKKQEYFDQEAAIGRERMRSLVDRSENLLTARTSHQLAAEHDDDLDDEDLLSGRGSGSMESNEGSEASGNSDEEDSGESTSSDEEDEEDGNPDAGLSIDELRAKYASIPNLPGDDSDDSEVKAETDAEEHPASISDAESKIEVEADEPAGAHMPDLEDVDDVMLDDEDSDSDTSSTPSEDEDDQSAASASDDESGEEHEDMGLLGFFGKKEASKLRETKDESDEKASVAEAPDYTDNAINAEQRKSESPNVHARPNLPEAVNDVPMNDHAEDTKMEVDELAPKTEADNDQTAAPTTQNLNNLLNYTHQNSEPQIDISPLVRGQLRPYQHAGFEWLAGMYDNETNGILADEMGLGKTFQTIALLAHIATRHHVWGPHLIVVPTSVILNWEIEFKKFLPGFRVLPYYGTQDERKEKRKGWNNDDKWNVVITSYQLALSDQVVLKRRRWHYLVLDEAHNIKNHKSQRWQTLLSFRSQARLLLTGTPLQNNLAELWSLLFFLAPEQDEEGNTSFGDLTQFSKIFHRPVDQILENGRGALDREGVEIVQKLHQVLRPHLLRRLKADVEQQMPKKYEHVTVCRLSKRQRQLYDGYMGLAGTRDSFASGNYMSIINCLMQLRKVCNHPDLFETRQIVTSFAMPKSAVADYEIKEFLVRRRTLQVTDQNIRLELCNLWRPNTTTFASMHGRSIAAEGPIAAIMNQVSPLEQGPQNTQTLSGSLWSVANNLRSSHLEAISTRRLLTSQRNNLQPAYPTSFLRRICIGNLPNVCAIPAPGAKLTGQECLEKSLLVMNLVQDLDRRSESMRPIVQRFCCTTPNVTAPGIARLALTAAGLDLLYDDKAVKQPDAFHEARVRLSIAFPDRSLIQYDCGKLQQLDKLLRHLQSGGHRAVIFTQMTKVLDILEQFMNLHGHRYLRLDGSTKIQQRQIITERFNTDTRILAFISSSRSGGLGINLTGADTVIFYDLDWNPAMDKQCQDRCHRIGQTRDVHIYRFVSEGTIEANILRKSNQKRMLDDVVIQEGDFTTEYFNRLGVDDGNEETDAALDKVFGGGSTRMLQQAEDKEDQDAAKEAQKEDLQADDADFGDKAADRPPTAETPRSVTFADKPTLQSEPSELRTVEESPAADRGKPNPEDLDTATREQLFDRFASNPLPQDQPTFRDVDEDGNACPAGSDDYLIRLLAWELQDVRWFPPRTAKDKKKKRKGPEFGIVRR